MLLLFVIVLSELSHGSVGLYPQESESRIVFDLSGVWNFRVSTSPNQGFNEKWYTKALAEVPHLKFTDTNRIIPCYCRPVRLLTWPYHLATMTSHKNKASEITLVGSGMTEHSISNQEELPTNGSIWDLKECITIVWWWVTCIQLNHVCAYVRTHTHTHARVHTHTHTHTQTHIHTQSGCLAILL